jgi:hypothetical protein
MAGGGRVLIACECFGNVREAFRKHGFDAWSCDLRPAQDGSEFHIQGDAIAAATGQRWDLMIAHPPCTYLSRAGARWWSDPSREEEAGKAAEFVLALYNAPIRHVAIENPIGQLNKRWRYPDQVIQPYDFGHPFSKATCLWLKNLPPLFSTERVAEYRPLIRSNVTAKKRAGKPQTGVYSGGLITAKTFQGIAEAMAHQWGHFISHVSRAA